MQLEEVKSEPREDQLNKAVVGPKLGTHLREGERVVMKMGAVPKPGSTSLPNTHVSSPQLISADTAPGESGVKKTFF